MKYCYLSHPLAETNPSYGTLEARIKIERLRDMERGDHCNVAEVCFENHWGTHIDAPNHFFATGKKICDYPADTWFFETPQIIECAVLPGQFTMPEDIVSQIDASTDLLIIKTGWTKLRGTEEFSFNNPGLAPELGLELRKNFPNIRAIAVEPTSISSMADRERGSAAHLTFLDPDAHGEPILLIEGIKLSENTCNYSKIFAVPLIIDGIDSAPLTIIGILEEELQCS
ncbi:MAG: cyclase family protein [Bacillota bacterium]